MTEDLGRLLDNLRFTAQVLGDARRTLICEPDRVADFQAAIEEQELSGLLTVRGSQACPVGQVVVIDEPALEASFNEVAQRAGRAIRMRP